MERALVKPKVVRRIVLTPRDAMIIRAVHRFRFFTTDQAQMLTGAASRNKLNDRMTYSKRPACLLCRWERVIDSVRLG